MHTAVYRAFKEILSEASIRGAVLEVGAVRGSHGLLGLKSLASASSLVGLNQEPQGQGILVGNANAMSDFSDGQFEAVLSNATLEHDPFFWRSLAEMHRVTAPGGLLVIGVPGYGGMGPTTFARGGWLQRLLVFLARLFPTDVLLAGTPTLGEHNCPGDYYRFSEQAVREIFMAGLVDVKIRRVLNPPRFIGSGRKP